LRGLGAAAVVVAVPVGAPETCQRLAALADRVVCLTMPEPLQAVGQWYEDFSQTTDEEVRQLLANSEEISRNISHSKMKTGFLM
jgi:putative phosphoribosyl transferase